MKNTTARRGPAVSNPRPQFRPSNFPAFPAVHPRMVCDSSYASASTTIDRRKSGLAQTPATASHLHHRRGKTTSTTALRRWIFLSFSETSQNRKSDETTIFDRAQRMRRPPPHSWPRLPDASRSSADTNVLYPQFANSYCEFSPNHIAWKLFENARSWTRASRNGDFDALCVLESPSLREEIHTVVYIYTSSLTPPPYPPPPISWTSLIKSFSVCNLTHVWASVCVSVRRIDNREFNACDQYVCLSICLCCGLCFKKYFNVEVNYPFGYVLCVVFFFFNLINAFRNTVLSVFSCVEILRVMMYGFFLTLFLLKYYNMCWKTFSLNSFTLRRLFSFFFITLTVCRLVEY